ncbi:hypothetical protein [Mycobacterium lepromatosis]|nr:hypothetical protein [Mycobacterium lepromatosis]
MYHVTSIDLVHTQTDRKRACARRSSTKQVLTSSATRYMNAHGPGTQQCDRAEAAILDAILNRRPEIYSSQAPDRSLPRCSVSR